MALTCDEIAQIELKRLHDIQVLLQALVYVFGGLDFLNSLALEDKQATFSI
jgi:hypothetical protein